MIEQTLKAINRLKVFPILLALTLIVLLNSVAFAAPPLQTGDQQDGVQPGKLQATGDCAQQYTVQAGDSLSAIANKFFGDLQSYNLIVEATNKAEVNNGFATIDDPNIIQVGQTLCIPAQASQQASTQQPGQLQQSAPQGTIANQNLLSVPEGMSKIVFQNLSSRDLIVDVTNGPTPQSVWVNPGSQHQFVIQPGQYTVMGHQPGVEFAITPNQLQLQPGQLVGVTCQDASQCQLFSTSQELALLDQGTVSENPNALLSPVPQVEDDEEDDKDDSPHTHNNDDNS